MLDDLMIQYKKIFGYEIELALFIQLNDEEKIKILKECINKKQELYENDYFNDNYMEIVI